VYFRKQQRFQKKPSPSLHGQKVNQAGMFVNAFFFGVEYFSAVEMGVKSPSEETGFL
jgi:hypothetical protein